MIIIEDYLMLKKYWIMPLKYPKTNKPVPPIEQRLPSISEVFFLTLSVAAVYGAVWMVMITTTNTGIQNMLAIFIWLSMFSCVLGIVYYAAKLIKAAFEFFTSGH